MLLDVFAKISHFRVCTFFLAYSAVEFHWTAIVLIAYECNGLDSKVNSLKRNPVSVRRQIDYVFQQLWGKVI